MKPCQGHPRQMGPCARCLKNDSLIVCLICFPAARCCSASHDSGMDRFFQSPATEIRMSRNVFLRHKAQLSGSGVATATFAGLAAGLRQALQA